MNAKNNLDPSAEPSALVLDSPEELTARSVVYAALSHGFLQPDESVETFFRGCGDVASGAHGEVVRLMGALVASARAGRAGRTASGLHAIVSSGQRPVPL